MIEQVLNMDIGVENNGIPASNGGLVGKIIDQVGDYHATQSGDVLKATYLESNDDFNGHATIHFNGAQYYEMVGLASTLSGLKKPFSVVQVLKFLNLNKEQCVFSVGGSLVNPIHFLSVDNLGRYKSQRRADDGAFLSDVKEVGQTAYVVEPVVVVWEFDGIKMSCYQNRHVVFKDQYQDVTTLSLIKATLGAKRWADNLQDYGDFELAYQEVRSSVLGQAAREDIVDLLIQTYGIDEYPYKSIAETIDTKVTVESRKPII